MKNIIKLSMILILLASFVAAGCGASKAAKGGAIGAAAGGAIGGVIGHKSGNTAVGAIIGATVGGAAGAVIGNYMDKQAQEMKKEVAGAQVERVGEGIKVTFPSGILFGFDSAELSSEARENVGKLAEILEKYPETNVLVEGHTDSDGKEEYNQRLSERRAQSVAAEARRRGVASNRITTVGYGENQPVASNETAAGKKQNRRVEVAVTANEKLKEDAKDGNISVK